MRAGEYMAGYVVRRLLMIIPIVLGVATLTFFLLKLAPGDPVLAFLGDKATPAMVAKLRESWGVNQPLLVQYFAFLFDLVRGNLGQSFIFQVPVVQLIQTRLPATLLLMLVAIVFAVRDPIFWGWVFFMTSTTVTTILTQLDTDKVLSILVVSWVGCTAIYWFVPALARQVWRQRKRRRPKLTVTRG